MKTITKSSRFKERLKLHKTLKLTLSDEKPGLYFETKYCEIYLFGQRWQNDFSINRTSLENRLRIEIFDKSKKAWNVTSFLTRTYTDKNTELCKLARNEFLKFEKQVCSQNLDSLSLLLKALTNSKLFKIFPYVF